MGDNVDLFKRGIAYAVAPVRRGTRRILAYKDFRKVLKGWLKKDKRWYFASGLARKPPFFWSLSR